MDSRKIAVDFVKWIMKIQDHDSWFEHSNGIWYKHMVGHMNTEALFDYYIEREGKHADLKNANCAIFDVMHRLWTVIDVYETDNKLYIATEKLGAIVITENGIYPLNTDGMDKYFKNGA